jgi:hypothetical protein
MLVLRGCNSKARERADSAFDEVRRRSESRLAAKAANEQIANGAGLFNAENQRGVSAADIIRAALTSGSKQHECGANWERAIDSQSCER